MSILIPSYAQGFARSAAESEHPERWRGLKAAFTPSLGATDGRVFDVTKQGPDGTTVGIDAATDWVPTKNGYALDLVGDGQYITVGTRDLGGDAGTILAWVKPAMTYNLGSPFSFYIAGMNGSGRLLYFYYDTTSTARRFVGRYRSSFSSTLTLSGETQFNSDEELHQWHQVAFSWDTVTDQFNIYLNGRLDANASSALPAWVETTTWRIGDVDPPSGSSWTGQLGNVLVYDRALDLNEIKASYINPNGFLELRRSRALRVPVGGAILLVVADLLHGHALDNTVLTQANTLSVQELSHSQTLDNVILSTNVMLAINELLHSQTIDNVDLTQANSLVVADAAHSQSIDNVVLSTASILAIDELAHSHTLDNIALTQANTVSVEELSHSNTMDNVDLTQANTLSVSELSHSHTLDNVVLSTSINLIIANLLHAQALDNIELTQANALGVADLLHSNTLDTLALTQANILTAQELNHSQAIDNVVLSNSVDLVVSDLLHGHAIDSMVLTQAQVLAVQDLLNSQTLDGNLTLLTQITLSVGSLTHAHTLENISWIVIVTPDDRIFLIDEENRVYVIASTDRIFLIN